MSEKDYIESLETFYQDRLDTQLKVGVGTVGSE